MNLPINGMSLAAAVASHMGMGPPPASPTAALDGLIDPAQQQQQALMTRAQQADSLRRVSLPAKILAGGLCIAVGYDWFRRP